MFAREHKQAYDPSSCPLIERPLATGRPLSIQAPGSTFNAKGFTGFRKENILESSKIPVYSPPRSPKKSNGIPEISNTPSKSQLSPAKSSLSSKSRYAQPLILDLEKFDWSEDEDCVGDQELPAGKSLHRHAKSVTFDAAPPQINEYEMTTPDPSSVASGSREGSYESVDNEEEDSFERGSSAERDDSFDESLEDTDKTPVVLPEDWRFMSPAIANEDLVAQVENPFDGNDNSPAPTARPSSAVDARLSPTRTDSTNSNGERRPLPPLPALAMPTYLRGRSASTGSLSTTVERVSTAQRTAPSPLGPASISKAEIQDMGGSSLSLEDRLGLMMIPDEEKPNSSSAISNQKFLEQKVYKDGTILEELDNESQFQIHEDDVGGFGQYQFPPRISRESILRKVKGKSHLLSEDDYEDFSPAPSSHPIRDRINDLDPDTPIPSLESEPVADTYEESVFIKQEYDGEESDIDFYSIPELYSQQLQSESYMDAIEENHSFNEPNRGSSQNDDDDESHYSEDYLGDEQKPSTLNASVDDEGPPTPKALDTFGFGQKTENPNDSQMSLPHFSSMLGEHEFGFGLETFLTPSPSLDQDPVQSLHPAAPASIEKGVERPITPGAQQVLPVYSELGIDSEDEPRTPDSVIRHTIARSPTPESPSVPELMATIKAPGSKLKTRPSITPADIQAMAETRRQVSQEIPTVPMIPEKHQNRQSVIAEPDASMLVQEDQTSQDDGYAGKPLLNQTKRKSSLVPLEIPIERSDGDLGFGLDQEFDRVIQAQKVAFPFPSNISGPELVPPDHAEYMPGQGFRSFAQNFANRPIRMQKGYLMRQNTKVVVASSSSHDSATDTIESREPGVRGTRSAGNSPRKLSQPHPWTTEPWNGKMRRKSLRQSGGSPQKKATAGPTPPLPGQQSNVASGLGSVTEDEVMLNLEEAEEGGERGILFVKVVRVKDLDLPLPKGMFLLF